MKKLLLTALFLTITSGSYAKEPFVINIAKDAIKSDVVVYNVSNAKMHTHDCEWAEKCTKNCIYLSKEEEKEIFYIPCAVCGGGILEKVDNIAD